MNRTVGLSAATAAIVSLIGLALCCPAFSHRSSAQHGKKSLDIRRHSDEPLELVDLTVAGKSLKANIKEKLRLRDKPSDGLDTVDFYGDDEWLKNLSVKARNISNKRITGLSAYSYFSPGDPLRLFRATLRGPSGPLEGTVLDPNEQIDVLVDTDSLDRAIIRLRAYGGDPAQATVSLAIEMVAFDDGIMWRKGRLIKMDPANPNRWIPVETKPPSGLSR